MRPSRWARSSPIAASPLRCSSSSSPGSPTSPAPALVYLGGPPLRPPAVRQPHRPSPARAPVARRHRARVSPLRHRRHLHQPVPSRHPGGGAAVRRAGAARAPSGPSCRWPLASAIWYGGITLLGSLIGADWDADRRHPRGREPDDGHRHRLVLVAVGAAWYWARRRRRARERLWHATRDALDPAAPSFLAGHRHRGRIRAGGGGAPGARAGLCRSGAHARRTASWSPDICASAGASRRAGRCRSRPRRRSAGPGSRSTPTGSVNVSAAPSVLSWWSGCGPSPSATAPSVRQEDRLMAVAAELLGVGARRGGRSAPAAPDSARRE